VLVTDPEIHPSEYRKLADYFYRANPADYLQARVLGAVVVAGVNDEGGPGHYASLSLGELKFTQGPEDVLTPEERDRIAALESTVVLHHTCESLLRLYFAHSNGERCPWQAVAGMRDFREFKRRVSELRSRLDEEATVTDLLRVFAFATAREQTNMPEEAWEKHRTALVGLVRIAAGTILDDANLYNAAKHGLAIIAGPVGMSLGPVDAPPVIDQHGPALVTLELSGKPSRWGMTTRWVRPERALAVSFMVCAMIRSLWEVGRRDHAQEADLKKVRFLDGLDLDELQKVGTKGDFHLLSMTESLFHVDDA
jgi:hypothetical protein